MRSAEATRRDPKHANGTPPGASRAPGAREARWRFPKLSFAMAVLALAGVLLAIYPSAASWLSQYEQSRLIQDYSGAVQGPSEEDAAEIRRAESYNAALTGTATLASGARIPSAAADGDSVEYSSLLAGPSGLMARIKIPSIDVDLPIYHGTSDATLERGVGHLEGTSLPVGGVGSHAVLTAHRGLASATLFSNLDRVESGDTFTIEVFGEVLSYRVLRTDVVAPEDTETLRPQADADLVTLVTCTPLGINSHRILVTGERVFPTPQEDLDNAWKAPDVPRFPWWIVIIGGSVLGLAVLVWGSGVVRGGGRDRGAANAQD